MENSVTLEAFILDQVYLFTCAQHEVDALKAAVELVNKDMNSVREHSKIRSRERIAVMVAINLATALRTTRITQTAETQKAEPMQALDATEVLQIMHQTQNAIDQGLKQLADHQ